MPALHIRDVPAEVVAAIKRRAAANRRSMQKELLVIVEAAAEESLVAEREPLELLTVRPGLPESVTGSRSEIYGDDGR